MVKIKVNERNGNSRVIMGEPGVPLLETLNAAGVNISSVCGGLCTCGTCHVLLSSQWFGMVPPPSLDEIDLTEALPSFDLEASRLSCQIQITEELSGIELTVAPED